MDMEHPSTPNKLPEIPQKLQNIQETKDNNKELINVIYEGVRKMFEGTELAGFFDMIFADIQDAQEDGEDPKKIDAYLRDGSFTERMKTTSIGQLFLQNQRRPGFFAMTFLENKEGKRELPSFREGSTYRCSFQGNKDAAKEIGLADLITDNEVGVIKLTSGTTVSYGRRIIEQGNVFYAKCDQEGNVPFGPAQYLPVREGDMIGVEKRLPIAKQKLELAQEYYKKRATMLIDPQSKEEMSMTNPSLPSYKGVEGAPDSERSLGIARKEWAAIRATDPRWGVACYRIANRLCRAIRGVSIASGTIRKIDYGAQGVWPKLPGTHAEELARSRQVPIGTAFHMSNSKDYRSVRGSNHWFTLTGYSKEGTPLFADQGGHAIPINKIARPGRPLLAVYY